MCPLLQCIQPSDRRRGHTSNARDVRESMNARDISEAKDPDLRASVVAMQRSIAIRSDPAAGDAAVRRVRRVKPA